MFKHFALFLAMALPASAQDIDARTAAERYISSPVQQQAMADMLSPDALYSYISAGIPGGVPRDQVDKALAIVSEEMTAIRPELEEAMIEAATQVFTVEELVALDAFYRSAEGQSAMGKILPYQQAVTGLIAPAIQQMQERITERLQAAEN